MSDRRPDDRWPTVELDPIARLRVMSRSLPGVAMAERTFDAPFDEVWGFVSDLETSVPQFDTDVRRLRVLSRDGESLTIRPYGHLLGFTHRVPAADVERGIDIAKGVRTGTYGINAFGTMDLKNPFGGYKASGIGRECGPEGIEEYLEIKSIVLPMDYAG